MTLRRGGIVNYNALRAQMALKGIKSGELSNSLGISKTAFYRKMKGDSEFTRGEIEKIIVYLNIENPVEIFFNIKVS